MRTSRLARVAGPALLAVALGAVAWPAAGHAATGLRLTASPGLAERGDTVVFRLRGGRGASCRLTVRREGRGAPVLFSSRIRTSLGMNVGRRAARGARVVSVRCGGRRATARFTVVARRASATPLDGVRLFFWADGAVASMPVANPSAIVSHVATPGTAITGVDASSTHVVWTQAYGAQQGVYMSRLDGSGRRRVHDSGPADPNDGVLVGNSYYWLQDDAIARADLDTGATRSAFIALPPSDLDGLDAADGLASDGRWLYFASCGNGAIGRVGLNGEQLDPDYIDAGTCVQDVAVNSTHVYWPILAIGGERPEIGRAGIDGAAVQRHWLDTPGGGELANFGVAADETHVYWTSSDSNAGGGRGYIGRARIDGSDMRPKLVTRGSLGIVLSIGP